MSRAQETPDQAPSPAPAKSAVGAEVRLISLLTGGIVLAGVILQQFTDPGPVPLTVTGLAVTVAVTAAAYLLRGRLLNTLAGFRMAAVVLTTLAIGAAVGTLILQNKPADFYTLKYGPVAWLIKGLRLDDIFHTVWFAGLIGLMNAGLIISAMRRWPMTARNAGFFAVHLGILVCLAGASLSSVFTVKGRIDLRVGGGAANTINVTKNGQPTGEQLPLGASVVLEQFDVDHYREQLRVGVYMPSKKTGNYELKASFDNEVGARHRLPEGNSLRIKAFYPDLVMKERIVEASQGVPALSVSTGGEPQWLVAGGRDRLGTPDGKTVVLFGAQRPEPKIPAPLHTLKLGENAAAQPVRLGETVVIDGTKVTALRYFPHFTYDIDKKAPTNLSDTPQNPALEVDIEGFGPRWLFAKMPGYTHGKPGPALIYAFAPEGGTPAQTIVTVGASDKSVLVTRPDGKSETLALADGLEVEGVKFAKLLSTARIEREAASASDQPKNPAVLLEVTEKGQVREQLLTTGPRDGMQVGTAILTFSQRGDEVKSFRSQVGVMMGQEHQSAIIAVNDPMTVGPWKLYQVNYNPEDPTYSGLEAVRDPGVNWVFAGFALMFFGVAYMVYVQPRIKRREA